MGRKGRTKSLLKFTFARHIWMSLQKLHEWMLNIVCHLLKTTFNSAMPTFSKWTRAILFFMRDEFLKYVSAFLLLGMLIYVVVSAFTDKAVLLEPFRVPPKLIETGYDGRAIAFAIIDQMNLIRTNAITQSNQNYIPTTEQIDVVVGGISLSSVKALIKEISGMKNVRITGEISFGLDGNWSVSTRFDGLSSQPLRHSSAEIEKIGRAHV